MPTPSMILSVSDNPDAELVTTGTFTAVIMVEEDTTPSDRVKKVVYVVPRETSAVSDD